MFNPLQPRHHHAAGGRNGGGAPLQRLPSNDGVIPPPLLRPQQPPFPHPSGDVEAGGPSRPTVKRAKTLIKPERAVANAPMIQTRAGGSHAAAPPRLDSQGGVGLGFSDSALPPSLLPLSHKLLPTKRGRTSTRQRKSRAPFSLWRAYSRAVTFFIPDAILSHAPFRRLTPETRQAWREKIALCVGALALGGIVIFITMFLNRTFCPDSAKVDARLMSELGSTTGTVGVYGWQIRVGGNSQATNGIDLAAVSQSSPGVDVTPSFTRHASDFAACSGLKTKLATVDLCGYVDPSGNSRGCPLGTISSSASSLALTNTSLYVGYSWDQTAALADHVVLNGWVLNLKPYIDAVPSSVAGDGIDSAVRAGLTSLGARDVTRALYDRGASAREIECLTQRYTAGRLDRMSPGCFFAQLSLYATLIVILGIVLIRFAMAATFHWAIAPRMARPKQHGGDKSGGDELFAMCLVTCYSEGEAGIKATLESIANADYSDSRKLLFVVADGRVTGEGETRNTPDICLGLMSPDTRRFGSDPPEPMGYMAVGSGSQRENRARVYAGHFVTASGRRTPMILVSKCGNVGEEQSSAKPGNRGKRDSQMVAMRFLQRVLYDDPMSPLDYEMFRKVQALLGVTPDAFEVMLMVSPTRISVSEYLR